MLVFTIRRLFQAIPILIVSSFVSFWLATVSGDPVTQKFALRNPPAVQGDYRKLNKIFKNITKGF